MADQKISALTALAAADVDTAADVLAIVDDSASATKKITVDNLRTAMGPAIGSLTATTSGTEHDKTSIPSWVKEITASIVGVSLSGTASLLFQLGDSGGVGTTNYASGAATITAAATAVTDSTAGFIVPTGGAAALTTGSITFTLLDASTNLWAASGNFHSEAGTRAFSVSGKKALSGTLDRVRLTTSNGSDTFDAGSFNIKYA